MTLDQENENIKKALVVAGRFGFISRDVFWRYISQTKRSTSYDNWSKLLTSGFFRPYLNSDRHLCLSRKGILAVQEAGQIWVGKAHPIYFEHDGIIMRLALGLEIQGLIKNLWLPDAVLKKLSNLEIVKVLGADVQKIPDLVFDLNLPHPKLVRCAVEIEKTRKSLKRYNSMVLSYMQTTAIDLVIVAYNDVYTKRGIKNSMKQLGYPQNQRPISFCRIADVKMNPSSFPLSLSENTISFDDFVQNLKELADNEANTNHEIRPDRTPESSPEKRPAKAS